MPQSRIRRIVRRKAPAKETRTMPLTAGIRLGPHEMLGLIGAGARGGLQGPRHPPRSHGRCQDTFRKHFLLIRIAGPVSSGRRSERGSVAVGAGANLGQEFSHAVPWR
jgi:hypothetical protein